MPATTLKKAAKELGVSLNDAVVYKKRGKKAIIEIELNLSHTKNGKKKMPDVFDNILAMAENVGIKDWALNHDFYLYGAPQRNGAKRDAQPV
ncbi:MAG: hypothetical protein AAB354_07380 [candidate division KSB1 bacterium]